jgi:hypothetical protein
MLLKYKFSSSYQIYFYFTENSFTYRKQLSLINCKVLHWRCEVRYTVQHALYNHIYKRKIKLIVFYES